MYEHLTIAMKACFSPSIKQESYYREFEEQGLRPAEDPALFLWRLKEEIRNADSDLSDIAFTALLC